jgi:hypothetical protein
MNAEQQKKAWGQIVAKAWEDAAFKQRLLADPAAALKAHGFEVPPGVRVRVVEDTASLWHLTLPPQPGDAELSEEQLGRVSGGRANLPFDQKP